jgi:hypothetical protein
VYEKRGMLEDADFQPVATPVAELIRNLRDGRAVNKSRGALAYAFAKGYCSGWIEGMEIGRKLERSGK